MEVFVRWVEEGGLGESVKETKRIIAEAGDVRREGKREEMDRRIVFGEGVAPGRSTCARL